MLRSRISPGAGDETITSTAPPTGQGDGDASPTRHYGRTGRGRSAAVAAAANGYVTPREEYFTRGSSTPTDLLENRQEKRHRSPIPGVFPQLHSPPNPLSLAKMISNARNYGPGKKISIKDRICYFKWTWFTMTMATGGVANVLHMLPYDDAWIYYVGLVFYFFNLFLFMMNCILITMRFRMVPGSFMHSFTDQFESLFIPSVVVSIATILVNTCEYGIPYTGPWLQKVMEYLYWIYLGLSILASAGMYLVLWSTMIFPIHTMSPQWNFPAYPLLLSAPYAANLLQAATKSGKDLIGNKLTLAFSAITVQGTGYLISFMVNATFLYRLFTQKLPRDAQRPGVFISMGPSGFTSASLVSLGLQTADFLPRDFRGNTNEIDQRIVAYSLEILSIMVGLWLWGLSVWFFLVSVGSLQKYLRREQFIPFDMTWWSFVFPNTAMISATQSLGQALDSTGLQIFGTVMTALLVLVWFLVFGAMLRALWRKDLLWPKGLEAMEP